MQPSKAHFGHALAVLFLLMTGVGMHSVAAQAPSPAAQATSTAQASSAPPSLTSQASSQSAFSGVTLCAPINLLILPNTTGGHSFNVTAEDAVISKIQATVEDANLKISVAGPLQTNTTIQLTVTLPTDALRSITHNGPGALIYVARDFTPQSLDLSTSFGAGKVYIDALTAENVTINHQGVDEVVVTGALNSVTLDSNSIAPVYLTGVRNRAEVNAGGVSEVFIDQSRESRITGSVSGLNRVHYTSGSCQLSSPFSGTGLAIPVCIQQAFIAAPLAQPVWSCGISIEGTFDCRPGTVLSVGTGTAGGSTFSSSTGTAGEGQAQAGAAQQGAATGQATATGTSAASSSVSAIATGGGTSTVSTETTVDGQTQGFTAAGGGPQSGVLVNFGPNDSASASSLTCALPPSETRMQV